MLELDKTLAELNDIAFRRLEEAGIGVSAGSIAKLLLTIINENVEGFYTTLKEAHAQAFLSKATGQSLDLIGQMLACPRNDGEDDEDYRYRISKQTLSLASSNQTAVRLACLSVEGVEDVVMRPYTHGTGSFSVYIVTNQPVVPDNVMTQVQIVLEDMKAYGIRAEAYNPILVPVEIRARLIFDKRVIDLDKKMLQLQAQQLMKDHVNSLMVGDELNIRDIERKIIELHSGIYSVQFYHFRVNNRPALLVPQQAQWNERFIEASVPDAILVS